MSGIIWAIAAGLTFGLFQSVNRVSIVRMDVYESTFLQLLVSLVILAIYILATGDLGRLVEVPASGYLYFAISGIIHFIGGWTLLNLSQKLIGAARTSPLLASTPLFGTILAVVTLGELPGPLSLVGMAVIILGVTIVHVDRIRRAAGEATADGSPGTGAGPESLRRRGRVFYPLAGLGAALAWAVSPIFIRRGFAVVDAPILGVAIGIFAATLVYGVILLVRGRRFLAGSGGSRAILLKLLAGVLVGVATLSRWYALSLVDVTLVLSLALLSVPTVMTFARLVTGRNLERITATVLGGAGMVVGGALILILPRMGGGT